MSYKFIIPGKPVVQQRWQVGKYGNRYDPSGKERKALSEQLLVRRVQAGKALLTSDLSLEVTFYITPGKQGQMGDLSNLLKALEDSGNGVLWKDDKQIISVHAQKIKCQEIDQRTEMEILEH